MPAHATSSKSVRFTNVVEKAGRPEVYLLLSETDPAFHKAVETNRIMSLSGEAHGATNEYGTVGYDRKRHGQLLLFPRSLKSFVGKKIVGIKYDLFAEPEEYPQAKSNEHHDSKTRERTKPIKASLPERLVSKPAKVIEFPASDSDHLKVRMPPHVKTIVKRALAALEKGNSVGAYKLLHRLIT